MTMRPILGSSVPANDLWPVFDDFLPRRRFNSTSSSDSGVGVSPIISPVGSSLSWSSNYWSQMALQTLYQNNDWRQEFESNGTDVPLEPIQSPVSGHLLSQYQCFPGFKYAELKSSALTTKADSPEYGSRVASNLTHGRRKRRAKCQLFCTFCKNNNEPPEVYNSHLVKDLNGIPTCPVIRSYNCPRCNSGGGNNGHTLRHCPQNKPGTEDYQPSIIKLLKNHRSADGKKKANF